MAKKYTVKRGQPKPNDGKENKNSSIWILWNLTTAHQFFKLDLSFQNIQALKDSTDIFFFSPFSGQEDKRKSIP